MGRKIGLAAVVLAAVGIIALKARPGAPAAGASPVAVAGAAQPASATAAGPAVVMIADPREADMQCPCGEIIRRVRAARASGIAVGEFAPDDADAARRYGVTIVPTVVFLDPGGKVLARHEGESSEILAAITAGLSKLEASKR
jgi:hypothetical protein